MKFCPINCIILRNERLNMGILHKEGDFEVEVVTLVTIREMYIATHED